MPELLKRVGRKLVKKVVPFMLATSLVGSHTAIHAQEHQKPVIVRVKIGQTLDGIIRSNCNVDLFAKYYGNGDYYLALQNYAKNVLLINPRALKVNQEIFLPLLLLKKQQERVKTKPPVLAMQTPIESKRFQSPFGGNSKFRNIIPFDEFGAQRSGGRKHGGIDLYCPIGTPLLSIMSGKVIAAGGIRAGFKAGNGLSVKIRTPDGFEIIYLHLSSVAVKAGNKVDLKTSLGKSGATGNAWASRFYNPHVHIQVRYKGKLVDPRKYLPF